MRIKKGTFIKHKEFKDVCIEVMTCFDFGHGLEIKGFWWNMAFVESFPLGLAPKRIKLIKKLEDCTNGKQYLGNWLIAVGPTQPCKRKEKWIHVSR